ncbi:MAG: guanylate kinase [Proteobacteria bacterium]|nr:guanylate kinase [Pseudomonadota bacterium]MDA1135945.1 guanylate kinase [Pseudomonadota bacterium]
MKKNNLRGVVLVISSPSGAGKTTICKKILEEVNGINLSVSVTTRKKRKDEVEGVDYFFKNDEEFLLMIKNDEFIENAKVFGNYYGTLKEEVLKKIKNGVDVLVDIDWQGTRQIQKHMPEDIVKIFILPPSIKELEYRLRNRASENEEDFFKRMLEARKEISHFDEYDFIIINENVNEAVASVKSILYSERQRKSRQLGITDFVKKLI